MAGGRIRGGRYGAGTRGRGGMSDWKDSFLAVLRDAPCALLVQVSQVVQRLRVTLLRCFAQPPFSLHVVLRDAHAFAVHACKVVLGHGCVAPRRPLVHQVLRALEDVFGRDVHRERSPRRAAGWAVVDSADPFCDVALAAVELAARVALPVCSKGVLVGEAERARMNRLRLVRVATCVVAAIAIQTAIIAVPSPRAGLRCNRGVLTVRVAYAATCVHGGGHAGRASDVRRVFACPHELEKAN